MIRVVSLFCGIGGSDLGLYRAAADLGIDVEVVAAIDSWDKAVEVYNANHPHPVARVADVKQMTRADLPDHDLVIGGPPCQPFSSAGRQLGTDDPRDCIPDFLRLSAGSAWVMENVKSRLVAAPFSIQLQASDFGDVTSRRRWFYSDHLLHVITTPSARRVRDIRDSNRDKAKHDRSLWMRSHGITSRAIADDGFFGSFVSTSWHGIHRSGDHNQNAGSLVSIPEGGARCPSLVEMARAHSIPDDWDWCGTTATAKGKMIANTWPAGMATAVLRATLVAMGALQKEVA